MQNYVDKYINTTRNKFDVELEAVRRYYVVKTLLAQPYNSILDVGSGTATYFDYVDQDAAYIIIEPERKFCGELSKYMKQSGRSYSNVVVWPYKIEDLSLAIKFDVIILSSVLHLVDNVEIVLNKIRSLSHKDTIVHINVPNAHSVHRVLGRELGLLKRLDGLSDKDLEFGHKRIFTMKTLIDCLTKSNMYITTKGSYLLKPFDEVKMEKLIEDEPTLIYGLNKVAQKLKYLGCEIFVEARFIL